MTNLRSLLIHAFVGWAACGAIIGIGFQFMTELHTLIVHAIGAPIVFGLLARHHARKHTDDKPLKIALFFLGFVMLVDFFVVGLLIIGSLKMFTVPLGTWIPFALIFIASYGVPGIGRKKA